MGSSGAPLRLPHFDVRSGLTCPTDSFAVVTPVAIDRVRADHCERIVRVEGDPSRAVTSVGSKGASKLREAIEISRFHAHVYYEAATREVAERVREGLAQSMSIADNLTLSKLAPLGPAGLIWPGRQAAAAARWIERLGIRCHDGEQRVSELSGGNQQKVALARLLYHGVDVALLDEPTRGIDIHSREQIYGLIDDLARSGKAVLMVSSQLPELLNTCDRIAVMQRGKLGQTRPVAEWDEHSLLMEATGAA